MDFNDRATGDAAILVGVTQILLAFGTGASLLDLVNPITLITLLLSGAVFWLLYSAATFAISRFLLNGQGTFAPILRVVGFAYPTVLLTIFGNLLFDNTFLILLVGGAWFVVIVANGLTYLADLSLQNGLLASIGGYAAVVVIQSILGGLRIF